MQLYRIKYPDNRTRAGVLNSDLERLIIQAPGEIGIRGVVLEHNKEAYVQDSASDPFRYTIETPLSNGDLMEEEKSQPNRP